MLNNGSLISLEDFINLVPDRTTTDKKDWNWTLAFNELMKSDNVVVFIPSGTYKLRWPADITKSKMILGHGVKLNMTGAFSVKNVTNFQVHGIHFEGAFDTQTDNASHGILMENTNEVIINNCKFTSIFRNGISWSDKGTVNNVVIEKCTFKNIGTLTSNWSSEGAAVYIQRGKNITIRDCKISHTMGISAISMQRCDKVTVENCTIEDTRNRGIQTFSYTPAAGTTPDVTDINTNIVIDRCTIRRNGALRTDGNGQATNGIFIRNFNGRPEDVRITNNLIEYCGENALEGAFTAYNNTLRFSGYYDNLDTPSKEMVYLHSRSIFTNNIINNSKKEGIKIFGDRRDIIVSNNIIVDSKLTAVTIQADAENTPNARAENIIVTNNVIRQTSVVSGFIPIKTAYSNGGTLVSATLIIDKNSIPE